MCFAELQVDFFKYYVRYQLKGLFVVLVCQEFVLPKWQVLYLQFSCSTNER